MTAGIAKQVVIDMDMDGWDIGLGTILSDATGFLMKIIEGKTIWWDNAVRISIIVMLLDPNQLPNIAKNILIHLQSFVPIN